MNRKSSKELFSNIAIYMTAFAIPVYIMLVILRQGNFYPFGDKTLFVLDMRAQYLEFFAYLRNMIMGDNSIFYCWSRSMGGNFLGLFAYYLASPLSFLVCLFPLENLDAAIMLLTLLKIGLCGLSFSVYANYLWKRDVKRKGIEPCLVIWILSACYALISYNMVYSSCLMWLDGVILFPVILLGVEKIMDGKKGLHYMLSLLALFLFNYYTGYMVGIFTAIYFLYRIICKLTKATVKISIWQTIRFGVCTLLALGMSAPLLYPVILDLQRGKLAFDNGYHFSFEPNFLLIDLLGKFRNGAYSSINSSGLPAVYCGAAVLFFIIIFFFSARITLREKAGAMIILTVFILSFYFRGLDMIWHGFRLPAGCPYRYSFLFSFFMIYMAFKAMYTLEVKSVLKKIVKKINIESIEKSDFSKIKYYILTAVFFLTVIDLTINGQALLAELESEYGYTRTDEYREFLDKNKPLVEWMLQQDDSLYRVNSSSGYSWNDAMLLGYNGMTHFSSTYNVAITNLTKILGLAQAQIWNSGYGSTPLLDSLFAVSYKISDRHEPISYKKIMDEGGETALYRNTLALPVAYATSTSTMYPDLGWEDNPYLNQNILLNAIAGKNESYFKELDYNYTDTRTGWIYTLTAEDTNPIYLYMYKESGKWADVYVNDVWFGNYFSSMSTCSLYIGSYEPGQQVTVRVEPAQEGAAATGAVIASLDMELLGRTLEEMRAGGMEITSHANGTLGGKIFVREGQIVMTSIPYEEGWTAWVDGQETELKHFAGAFLILDIPAGEHEIFLSYVSPGFYTGLKIFVMAAIAAIFYFCKRKVGK